MNDLLETQRMFGVDLLKKQAGRIETLEVLVQRYAGETVLANSRIETLEAALREIEATCVDEFPAKTIRTLNITRAVRGKDTT